MNESEYISLITKVLAGEADSEMEKALDKWLGSDPANRELFEHYKKVWEYSDKYEDDYQPDLKAGIERFERSISPRRQTARVVEMSSYRWALRIAAVFAVIAGLYFTFDKWYPGSQTTTYATNNNERQVIFLPDSSKVWLNKKSRIIYNKGFTKRLVNLEGEAFFEVRKLNGKPFAIEAATTKTEVFGTSFNINAYKDNKEVKVTVVTGKVAVSSVNNASGKEFLMPGERAVIDKVKGTVSKMNNEDRNFLFWKNNKLVFDDDNLASIVEVLENNFELKIKLRNPDLGKCKFTGTIETDDLEEILEVLSTHLNIETIRKGKTYEFDGTGCQ